jgi:pyruvate/2-oxoglutarate/acetoin dehydrogenase E1 component
MDMKYKSEICKAMLDLSKSESVRFVGYNVRFGKFGGTLNGINENQLIETPVAENLMAGIATGLALNGFLPVLCFERFDFILNALDAIVNHLDKFEAISAGEFKPRVIIRVVVGNTKSPLFTGATHTQDFSESLRGMLNMPVIQLKKASDISMQYLNASAFHSSCVMVEYKDLY